MELNSAIRKKSIKSTFEIPVAIKHVGFIKYRERREKKVHWEKRRVDLEAITQLRYQSHGRERRKSGDPRLFNRRPATRERDDGTIERATAKSVRFHPRSSVNAPIWTLQTAVCCRWQPFHAVQRTTRERIKLEDFRSNDRRTVYGCEFFGTYSTAFLTISCQFVK